MGGVHPPLRTFWIFDFVLQDTKIIFCQCDKNYLRHLCLDFFHFDDERKVVSVYSKGRGVYLLEQVLFS